MPVPEGPHPQLGTVKLGKLPPKLDRRTMRLETYIDRPSLPEPPPTLTLSALVTDPWGVYLNNQLGDCAIAAPAHAEMIWTAQSGTIKAPTDAQVLAMYEAVGGYKPGDPQSDNGCYMLDVLNYWRHGDLNGQSIFGYTQINARDPVELKTAMFLFGGVYVGLNLPMTAQAQVGRAWEFDQGPGSQPGGWGGHAVWASDYHEDGSLELVTWGALQHTTWAFWTAYVSEVYAVLPQSWQNAPPKIDGFDFQRFAVDLGMLPPSP